MPQVRGCTLGVPAPSPSMRQKPCVASAIAIGRPHSPQRREQTLRDRMRKPSSTSGSTHRKRDLVGWWRDELEPRQINSGVAILVRFGLADVYNDTTLPDHQVAANLLAARPDRGQRSSEIRCECVTEELGLTARTRYGPLARPERSMGTSSVSSPRENAEFLSTSRPSRLYTSI